MPTDPYQNPSPADGGAVADSRFDLGDVLIEIRSHARGGLASSSSTTAMEQTTSGDRGSLLSLFSAKGIYQLKEKWNMSKRPIAIKRSSLFVSPNVKYIAVSHGNRLIILQEGDCYLNPCGNFTSSDKSTSFRLGAWLEPRGILGVVDYTDTVYFINANGEEISRIALRELKISVPVVGLFVSNYLDSKQSSKDTFCVITLDGSFHHIEINQKPSVCICSSSSLSHCLKVKDKLPASVACMDFSEDLSLIVMVCPDPRDSISSPGSHAFYLLRLTMQFQLELLLCCPIKGKFSASKSYSGSSVDAKLLLSPLGEYVAALDMNGNLGIYNIDHKTSSLSVVSFDNNPSSESLYDGSRRIGLKDITDCTWWSANILLFTTREDIVRMLDLCTGVELLHKNLELCKPILERAGNRQGCVFALQSKSLRGGSSSENYDTESKSNGGSEKNQHFGADYMYWSLVSLSEKSVKEMYEILIQKKEYESAANFASRFDLDKDEIFKSQWKSSGQRIKDLNVFLSNIKDLDFVLFECVNSIPQTEDDVVYLLSYGLRITDQFKFLETEDDKSNSKWKYRKLRLQLLQYRDRLETFLGINMGRFSAMEYSRFRASPLIESAKCLAEAGKIGALNLLFKRHPYSLASNILDILAAIPETVPVLSYGQLLPGRYPSDSFSLRDEDWVECSKMARYLNDVSNGLENNPELQTEHMLKSTQGVVWPTVDELSEWYRNRAQEVDNLSGQLDNCLALIEFACRKDVGELQQFLDDITYLHQLIYSNDLEAHFFMSLATWQQLSDYEKFKMMIDGLKSEKLVNRLREKAIPFMLSRIFCKSFSTRAPIDMQSSVDVEETFVVRWLKEVAAGNQLDTCLAVIEEGCNDQSSRIFSNGKEAVETTIECLYLCTLTDCWHGMASLLSKLPMRRQKERLELVANDPSNGIQDSGSPISPYSSQPGHLRTHIDYINTDREKTAPHKSTSFVLPEELEMRVKIAEGHVEAGRLLAYYQVPKPMAFFQSAHLDEKGVKQLLRLILSKFSRRQPAKSDSDWANMWYDMLVLQEKAFSFVDKEYILIEFCRGLLKSGKFSLARNYLKGYGNIPLATEKVESLVIQAAREYFFSASTLTCSEILMAKECLNLLSHSDSAKAESDIIDALTINLPNLGVTILPVQFKQIRNPMEIINMVIRSQRGVYLDVDELIELGKLLGLRSQDDVASIQEAVAREAAIGGDLQLSFELCLALAKKGYGPIWDLASAIARGPVLDNMDTASRRQLLGFSLSYCDEESIGELLHAWKEIDMQIHREKLMILSETEPPSFPASVSTSFPSEVLSNVNGSDVTVEGISNEVLNDDQDVHLRKSLLLTVVKDPQRQSTWDHFLKENGKTSSFVVSQLPWLLELSKKNEVNKSNFKFRSSIEKCLMSVRMQAGLCILSWLAENNLGPKDDLIATLANISMEFSAGGKQEEDFIVLSFLLNLYDAYHGVELIDGQLRKREHYQELQNVMNIGMLYSNLQSSVIECTNADWRRMLLLCRIHEKQPALPTAVGTNDARLTFWREWKSKLEEHRKISEQARELEQIIPGVESARFLSGDKKFIEDSIFSFIDLVKFEKKHIIREATNLADTYGLSRTKVLIHYFSCCLVSEYWTNEEILAEFSDFREDLVKSASEIISMICSVVYPEIRGENKKRLSCIYSILSACYKRLKNVEGLEITKNQEQDHVHPLELFHFYHVLENECNRVSSIENLDFKRISGLYDLNFESFNEEACKHISGSTIEPLADMVHVLTGIYPGAQALGLICRSDVYKQYILNKLAAVEDSYTDNTDPVNSDNFATYIEELEKNYDCCRAYIQALSSKDVQHMIGKFFTLCIPSSLLEDLPDEQIVKPHLIGLLNFWIRLAGDIPEDIVLEEETDTRNSNHLSICLSIFRKLVMENEVSGNQGWNTVLFCFKVGLINGPKIDVSLFYKAMVLSGCGFKEILEVSLEEKTLNSNAAGVFECLLHLYVGIMNSCLNDLLNGSGNWENVCKLLQSLSKLPSDNLEDLQLVRLRIWEILNHFSGSMQVPSHDRVFALELMQSISGRNSKSDHVEDFPSVESWEGWHDPLAESIAAESIAAPSRVTSNLVALRSTELVTKISPMLKITSDNLSTVDSAISCFMVIVDSAHSVKDFEILQAVLVEWEEVFVSQMGEKKSVEFPATNWSSEEWDEGWENLAEESLNEVEAEASPRLHPLHACWTAMLKKIIMLPRLQIMTKLIDHSLMKTRYILLEESEADEILQLLVEIDYFIAVKIMLLLPYENLWFRSLRIFEDKSKLQVLPSKTYEPELLMLILSSGVLPHIATDPAYGSVFKYICHLVGRLSHSCQKELLNRSNARNDGLPTDSILYSQLLLPCFVGELVTTGQYLLAGHLVSQWMHVHPTFTSVNIVAASLTNYLEGLLQKQQHSDIDMEVAVSHSSLPCTYSKLMRKMDNLLKSSLSAVQYIL